MSPVATLHTCYPEKFGVPRQSGLVPAAWGVIEFAPEFQREEAIRGIEAFSHLWLITQFHLIDEAESAESAHGSSATTRAATSDAGSLPLDHLSVPIALACRW